MEEICRKFPRIRDLREKRNLPVDNLIALAKLYNVSTDYILGLTDNPNPK